MKHVFLTAVKPDYAVSVSESGLCDSVEPLLFAGFKKDELAMIVVSPSSKSSKSYYDMYVAKGRKTSDEPFRLSIQGDFTKLEERILETMTQEQHEQARRELGWPMKGQGR